MKNVKIIAAVVSLFILTGCFKKHVPVKSPQKHQTKIEQIRTTTNPRKFNTLVPIMVTILTQVQADTIMGKFINPANEDDGTFYPVRDKDSVMVISPEEVAMCTNDSFMYIKNLPTKEWVGAWGTE